MPRYLFDISNGDDDNIDRTGTHLASIEEAKREAAQLAGGLLRDNPDTL